jgi:HEPN domain-containing protein
MLTDYVKNWFSRADEDLALIEVLLKEKSFFPNPICFHAEQATEKYLKGFLAHHEMHVRKVHDLEILVEDCQKVDQSFDEVLEDARFLNQFYIESRYPDDYIEFSSKDAEEAYGMAKKIKEFVLGKIGK